jgi:D-alanyl-D-alanine carboxypeptidase
MTNSITKTIAVYSPKEPVTRAKVPTKEMYDLFMKKSFKAQMADHHYFLSTPAAFFGCLNAYNTGHFDNLGLREDQVIQLQAWFAETNALSFIKFEEMTSHRVVAIVKEKHSDKYLKIEFETDGISKTVKLNYISKPEGFIIERTKSDQELSKAAQSHLEKISKEKVFSGTVLIAKKGIPIFSFSSLLSGSRFNIASTGKMFTAVGILQLVEKGKIDLDGTIGQYLPDYPNKQMQGVTIRQLLNHTAGTGDIFGDRYKEGIERSRNPKDYIKIYGDRSPAFTPGKRYEYSNYGYILLGAILEAVSKQSYAQYVHENIFVKAGMASSGSYWNDRVADPVIGMTRGYGRKGLRKDAPLESNKDVIPECGNAAAGGGYSTASDLLRFANALQEGQLLGSKYVKMLMSNSLPISNEKRGLGAEIAPDDRWFGHSGSDDGFNTAIRMYPNSHYTVIVLGALDPPSAERVADWIDSRLPS